MNRPNDIGKRHLLDSLRREINVLQMILDKDEDDSTKEMFRKVAHAEKYLKLAIDGNEINNFHN